MPSRRLCDYGDFLTIAETAAVLRIGKATAYQYVRDGELPAHRMGHRIVIAKAVLEQIVAEAVQGGAR
jgi:excisionase family DNA binding protein